MLGRLLRDIRVRRALFQVVLLVGVAGLFAYLYGNLLSNTRPQQLSFDYLSQPYDNDIPYSDFNPRSSIRDALVVGIKNTVVVSLTGIALILVLGTLVGVARLSANWLVRKAAGTYVETFRNLPPLLCILLTMALTRESLPEIGEATEIAGLAIFSNQVEALPSLRDAGGAGTFWVLSAVALAGALLVRWYRNRVEDRTGQPQHGTLWALGVLGGGVVVAWLLLGGPLALSRPEVVQVGTVGRRIDGGVVLNASFFAVLVGLVLYTATHVAEIVRGSIQAVPKGQNEAASAIGLSPAQRLRYVVLPQAFRVATPPTINQFLNLTKNTSLGLAVGYIEMTAVTRQAVNRGNPAIPAFLVLMGLYLVLSLTISAVSNVANRRLRIVER